MRRWIATILLLLASLGLVAGGSSLRWLHQSCDSAHHAAVERHAEVEHHHDHAGHAGHAGHPGYAGHGTTDPAQPEAPTDGACVTCLALSGLVTPQVRVSMAPVLHAMVRRFDVPAPETASPPRPPRATAARPPPRA